MPSLTEDLQTNLRLSTGTQNTFNGDLHAYLDSVGIAKGQLNERMIAYVATLNSTVTNYSSAFSYALKNPQNFISPFASASFFAPLTSNLTLSKGTGSITSSRASTATVQDFEGLTKLCKAGEARFNGARRVENLNPNAETLVGSTNSGWTVVDATHISIAGAGSFGGLRIFPNFGGSKVYTVRFEIQGTAGRKVNIYFGDQATLTKGGGIQWTFDGTVQQVSFKVTSGAAIESYSLSIDTRSFFGLPSIVGADLTQTIYWDKRQVEEVTGQSNQNPSEYIPPTENSAGALGVKYFETINGNTVVGNVVTEATGTSIPATTLQGALVEPAITNYAFPSGPQVAAVTCTTAALTAAAYTLSFKGTGTVVGTGGFVCNTTGTGANVTTKVTVTATSAAATLTPSGLVTELQLELGTTNTSVIPTGTAAVTRAADILTAPTAGNLTAAQGWMYGEFTYYDGMGNWLCDSYTDASNYLGLSHVSGTSVGLRKAVAGVITDAVSATALVAGTRYKLAGTWGPNGMFASLNGVALGSNASTTPAVLAATVQLNAYQTGGEQGTGCNHRFGTTQLTQAQLNAMTA